MIIDNTEQFDQKINFKLIQDGDSIDLKAIMDSISVKEVKEDGTLGPEIIQEVKNILGDWNE